MCVKGRIISGRIYRGGALTMESCAVYVSVLWLTSYCCVWVRDRQQAYIILYNILATPILFCFCVFALQCNQTQVGLQNDRLASLVQSELLIRFSVHLIFVKARQPTPAFPKSERDGLLHWNTSLFYHLLSGFSSFYIILLENKNNMCVFSVCHVNIKS